MSDKPLLTKKCEECGIYDLRHKIQKGRCGKCYHLHRWDTEPSYRERLRRNQAKYEEKHPKRVAAIKRDMGIRSSHKLSTRYSACISLSKRRGLDFTLTFEEYSELLKANECFYCCGPLPKTSYGLDKMDNKKGYVLGNVVPCCQECNRLKGNQYTPEETKIMIKALKEYRNDC